MKTLFITLITLFSVSSFAGQSGHFVCSNAPVSKWGTYFCAYGDITADGKTISGVTFGTCEGSQNDQEEEPVEIFEFDVIHHNPALAAKSAQWKNVPAFDVSSDLGQAVLYHGPGMDQARVKIEGKDIRLSCRY